VSHSSVVRMAVDVRQMLNKCICENLLFSHQTASSSYHKFIMLVICFMWLL